MNPTNVLLAAYRWTEERTLQPRLEGCQKGEIQAIAKAIDRAQGQDERSAQPALHC